MSRKKKSTDDSWAAAWYDWCVDVGQAAGIVVRVVLHATERKGVWKVRVEAVQVDDGKAVGVLAAQSTYWPNEKADGLQATVYQLMLALDRVLADIKAEEEAQQGT